MGYIVSFIAQKGGVGKSTLARALATEISKNDWSVKIADLDTQQGTVTDWHRVRLNNGFTEVGSVEPIAKVKTALKHADNHDLLVIDAGARASSATAEIAKHSDIVVLPTCASRDDLVPAIRLAHEIRELKIPNLRMVMALTRVTTPSEIAEARDFIAQAGYDVLDGELLEKPSYRQAQNEGLAVTETRFPTLNDKAKTLVQSIVNLLTDV